MNFTISILNPFNGFVRYNERRLKKMNRDFNAMLSSKHDFLDTANVDSIFSFSLARWSTVLLRTATFQGSFLKGGKRSDRCEVTRKPMNQNL
jgi:hypothetical protein